MDVFDELISEHRAVQDILHRFEMGQIGPDDPDIATLVHDLSVHAAAEELVLYPAVDAVFPMEVMVEQHLKEHQLVKELLVQIERTSGLERAPLLRSLAVYIRAHVEHEEGSMFPHLRAHADDDTLRDIGASLEKAKQIAPTHPHPHASRRQPWVTVAGAAAGLLDKTRDALRR